MNKNIICMDVTKGNSSQNDLIFNFFNKVINDKVLYCEQHTT